MARQLRELGFDAVALKGGYNAWREKYPIEPKQRIAVPQMATYSGDSSSESAAGVPEPQRVSSITDNDDA